MNSSMQVRTVRWLSVLWPAFLVTIPLVGLVFSAFDPATIDWTDAQGEPLPATAVYSLGFLVVWALVSVAVAMARSFAAPPADAAESA